MDLKTSAARYYGEMGKTCAEALLTAARDELGMSFTDAEIMAFTGFAGGMGCKSTCGGLTGAIAILSKRYAGWEDLRELCGGFVALFEREMGSIVCGELEERYRTEQDRCVVTVEKTAKLLQQYIDRLDGRGSEMPSAEGCTVPEEEIKRLKGLGFLNHKGTNRFNARVITRNGRITGDEAIMMGEAANRYGDGHMALTTRLTMEISGVDYADTEAFIAFINAGGMETGGTGSKVRPVVSCKGTTCQYGLYDTYALSEAAHERFYKGYHNVVLPHKFKIAFGGCPNNCVKPDLNDIGIIGARVPVFDAGKCRGCKACQVEKACPIKACTMQDDRLVIDEAACNNCGRCVGKCPFHANDEGRYGWRVTIGGRWGKRVAQGRALERVFTSREEVLDTIEKTILFFRSVGITGERLADTVARVGFEKAQEMILGDELLQRKNEILGITVKGGASC